ncbi:heme o synthase [Bacillus sp. FJAT-50079]|uniref:heme o synthase n=1 Tax=Bacillus sp. FJAT-50079 TaxID=2833577 RepID=UPI0020166981|nr:heme o synthase [Bacillus sp. FJAT-50079]
MDEKKSSTFLADVKSLFKLIVLIVNVLPVLTGFWLAIYFTNASFFANWNVFVLTMLGSTLVMAGALVLNNWYDVDIDSVMERTKNRPTVTGNFSLRSVLILGIALSAVGFIFMLFTTFEATIYAFIGWVVYVFPYTMWSKRKYTINTVIGSVSGAVTPLIGWAAIDSSFHIVPMMLALIIFIWQMPHTYAIAIRKHDDYKRAGVAMLPVVRGFTVAKWHNVVYIVCLLPIPFFLKSLGTFFIGFATFLTLVWLVISIRGFFVKDNIKWAYVMFLYSVNYLAILFITMIIVTM